jgi:hypothetical protein
MTWDMIQDMPRDKWNFYNISQNPNINWDIVSANLDEPWDYSMLCGNKMGKHPYFQKEFLK